LFVLLDISWIGINGRERFYNLITEDENVTQMMSQLSEIVQGKIYNIQMTL